MYGAIVGVTWLFRHQSLLGQGGRDPAMLTIVFLFYFSFVVYEGLMLGARGQTLGKMAMKVRVVRPDGSPLTRRQAWGRAAARTLFIAAWLSPLLMGGSSYQIPLFVLGNLDALVGLLTPRHTALHDLAARTRVFSAE